MKLTISTLILLFFISSPAYSHQGTDHDMPPKLRSYEANTVGITHDDNDVSYLDFKLSLMYPMFHDGTYDDKQCETDCLELWPPKFYFAFTGRFGQYINTRDSSPVIGKRFNPKIFNRFWYGDQRYIDMGIAHESNGQRIGSLNSYNNLRSEYLSNGENPDFANDSISRGWDYISTIWKHTYTYKSDQGSSDEVSTYIDLKYFLPHGPLQGDAEEANPWEPGFNNLIRKNVDGITLIGKYSHDFLDDDGDPDLFSGYKLALIFTTGYEDTLEHNTLRFESTFKIDNMPIMLWWSKGYGSDLIDYNQRVNSFGIALELKTFLNEI